MKNIDENAGGTDVGNGISTLLKRSHMRRSSFLMSFVICGAFLFGGSPAYKLYVEFTEDNGQGKVASFNFTKSTQPQIFTFPDQTYISNVSLNFIPTSTTPAFQGPYGGTARALPGTLQAVDYDVGGEGVAYHDLVAGNVLGAYRTDSRPACDSLRVHLKRILFELDTIFVGYCDC